MRHPSTIAIDGPAASGKSTIGGLLAERLGYLYFDTGVMYRAVTWAVLAQGVAVEDEAGVTALAERLQIDVVRPTVDDGRQYTILADGQDVTWQIRRPEVDRGVSPVSAYAGVRAALTAQQRRIGQRGQIVMVGRDIGTVVLPEADTGSIFRFADDPCGAPLWSSQDADNSDGQDHMRTFRITDGPSAGNYAICWEDLPCLGDQDHQDLIVEVSGGGAPVPEPAALAMIGLGGLGVLRRRRRK